MRRVVSRSMSARPARPGSDGGFTMIELLVGVALAALIGVLLVQSLAIARQGLAYHARLARNGDILAAQTYLRNVLLQAQPLAGNAAAAGDLSFAGEPATMSFISTYAPNAAIGGLYRIDLVVERPFPGAAMLDLIVRQQLYRPKGDDAGSGIAVTPSSSVLVANISAAGFQYYVPAASGAGHPLQLDWSPSWRHATELPVLVGVTMDFAPGDRRVWPRLNVPIYATAGSNINCPPRVACH